MSDAIKVQLDDASHPQLRYYCEAILNLDGIKPVGQSSSYYIARIRAVLGDEINEIELPADSVNFAAPKPAAIDIAPTPEGAIPSGVAGQHYMYDPKVELTIAPTNDRTRSRDVQVAVNGDAFIMQRGKRIAVPYRVYLALKDAIETVSRDTDEINPQSQMPVKEWVEQPSYSFTENKLPTDEQIAEWHRRTDNFELRAEPVAAAA